MQQKIEYRITEFVEPEQSYSPIRNVLESNPNTFWETLSEYALLSIEFQPIYKFEIRICML
jgi:hypothetical protein